jgi:hypothetical protein
MHARRMILGMGLLCVTFAAGIVRADGPAPSVQGPWLGVWKLNVEKSTYQTNKPPAGTVRTYAMTAAGPDSFDVVIDSKSPEGVQTMHMELRGGKFDGKDYKEVGNPFADANRFRILGERSYGFVETKNGVEVITITAEISADGKTRTSQQKGKGPDGKPTLNIAVWDRQ